MKLKREQIIRSVLFVENKERTAGDEGREYRYSTVRLFVSRDAREISLDKEESGVAIPSVVGHEAEFGFAVFVIDVGDVSIAEKLLHGRRAATCSLY